MTERTVTCHACGDAAVGRFLAKTRPQEGRWNVGAPKSIDVRTFARRALAEVSGPPEQREQSFGVQDTPPVSKQTLEPHPPEQAA